MSFSLVETIDAVASDLTAQAGALGLPAFSTQKYAKPLIENVEIAKPILAVFPFGMDAEVLSTSGDYQNPNIITVGWFEPVPESLEAGVVDPAKASAALRRAEKMIERLKTYYAAVPGLGQQSEATITRIRYGRVRGGVFACEISMRVTTWS